MGKEIDILMPEKELKNLLAQGIDEENKDIAQLKFEYEAKVAQLSVLIDTQQDLIDTQQDLKEMLEGKIELLDKANCNVAQSILDLEKTRHRFMRLSFMSFIVLMIWLALLLKMAFEKFFL